MRQLELFGTITPAPPEAVAPTPRAAGIARAISAPAPPREDAGELRRQLAILLREDLSSLTLTDNTSRIVSARSEPEGLAVRIHRSFVDAPPPTLKRVAEFLNGARGKRRQQALAAIRDYFDRHREFVPGPRRRRPKIDPQGRFFDLDRIRDDLNRRFFDARLEIEITWGRLPPRRRRRGRRGFSIRLGSYHSDMRLVRIHRALDRGDVPLYVIESVVYHEMLHDIIPPVRGADGRRQIHTAEFRRREREFPQYEEAEAWLAENLESLAGLK